MIQRNPAVRRSVFTVFIMLWYFFFTSCIFILFRRTQLIYELYWGQWFPPSYSRGLQGTFSKRTLKSSSFYAACFPSEQPPSPSLFSNALAERVTKPYVTSSKSSSAHAGASKMQYINKFCNVCFIFFLIYLYSKLLMSCYKWY